MARSDSALKKLRLSAGWKLKSLCARNPRASLIYETIALALDPRKNEPPIVIFQMGRVGSRTLEESLRAALPGGRIHHVHFLSEAGQKVFNDTYRNSPYFRRSGRGYVVRNRHLASLVLQTLHKQTWQVVTAVRDPIARNVSMFFTVLLAKWPYTNARERMRQGETDPLIDDLIPIFLNEFDHDTPLTWFDDELKAMFQVDVFSEPFDKSRGYHIYCSGNTSVLLLRLESMNECAPLAFGEFLGLPEIQMRTTNVAAGKDYNELYRRFIERLTLPDDYIERMYTSRLATHFYSDEEIELFRTRWMKGALETVSTGR